MRGTGVLGGSAVLDAPSALGSLQVSASLGLSDSGGLRRPRGGGGIPFRGTSGNGILH